MKKLLVILAVVSLLATAALAGSAKQGSWTGMVSDDKCGARGADNAECTKKCLEKGAKMVFVNDADKSVVTVANPDTLKDHIGHHIKVNGTLENNTLTVTEVSMVEDKKGM